MIKPLLEGGTILSAGARAIVTGGWQSLPKVEMPGALLIGDTAGLLNVPKIKGTHQAIRSGMLAAEHLRRVATGAGRLRREAARLRCDGGAEEGPQHQARLQARPVVRHVERRVGNRHRRPVAVDAEEQARLVVRWTRSASTKRPSATTSQRTLAPRDRLPASTSPPPNTTRTSRCTSRSPTPASASPAAPRNTTTPAPASARPASTRSSTTPTQRQAPADQRRQLRALQDLRHQGPVRDHHLGHAGGRRGAELPEPLSGATASRGRRRGQDRGALSRYQIEPPPSPRPRMNALLRSGIARFR